MSKLGLGLSKVYFDLHNASSLIQSSNALERLLVIWDHTVLPADRGDSPNFTLAFTSTHFTVPRRWKAEST